MLPVQDAQAQLSRVESSGKYVISSGYPLLAAFFSEIDEDNPRYPHVSRIAA